jgi:hypothetical protein
MIEHSRCATQILAITSHMKRLFTGSMPCSPRANTYDTINAYPILGYARAWPRSFASQCTYRGRFIHEDDRRFANHRDRN